jgi:hypothetical protein
VKIVEIVPRERARLYGTLVAREAAIRKKGRGTYMRVGRKTSDQRSGPMAAQNVQRLGAAQARPVRDRHRPDSRDHAGRGTQAALVLPRVCRPPF